MEETVMSDYRAPEGFKVVSIFPVRNEEDVIEATIGKLIKEGVEVFILDNWSDDGTWEILQGIDHPNLHIERWPEAGPDEYFSLEGALRKIEDMALEHPDAWILGQGSDEVLVPPWPGVSLRDALCRVEKEGYNFIEVLLHNFEPTDDDFVRGMDPEEHFDSFFIEKERPHRRIWRQPKGEKVKIADNASHNINFNGRKIYPTKWIMKHYRLRSQRHGEQKMADRRKRYKPEELKKGWHVHYNHIKEGHNFIKDPKKLESFRAKYPDLTGGKRRMKEYLEVERSERSKILYDLIKDCIDEDIFILDIGPSAGIIYHHMKKDKIKPWQYVGVDDDDENIDRLKGKYKGKRTIWEHCDFKGFEAKKFRLVIHTAMSSLQVGGQLWKIHRKLVNAKDKKPKYVFLEAGEYKEGESDMLKTFEMVKDIYLNNGYRVVKDGDFVVEAEGFPVPHRFWAILEIEE